MIDFKPYRYIKCTSEDEARWILSEAHDQGYKWYNSNDSVLDKTNWGCSENSILYYHIDPQDMRVTHCADPANDTINVSDIITGPMRLNVEQATYLNKVYDDISFCDILKSKVPEYYEVLKRVVCVGKYDKGSSVERAVLVKICVSYVEYGTKKQNSSHSSIRYI